MRIVGFGAEDEKKPEQAAVTGVQETQVSPTLVSVRFEEHGRTLTYYNDRFALKEGDRVFVSGKLEGQIGLVESVTTKFRIRLSDYQRVVSTAQTPIAGTYTPVMDKMRSYDAEALAPEAFRKWILPPDPMERPDDEITVGGGWTVPIDDPARAEGVDHAAMDRAVDYCRSGKVAYIAVRDGVGTAYIEGRHWYEVTFRLDHGALVEAFCDCPYCGLCKHLLAVGITLTALLRRSELDLDRDFVLIDASRFYCMLRQIRQPIRL